MSVKYREYTADWVEKETPQERKKRALKLLRRLKKIYPKEKTMLNYENPVQLLVAVMLSAQCTDKKVNEVTVSLFKKYRTAQDFAKADVHKLEQEIRSTGFYHTKAKHIIAATKILVDRHSGNVPQTMEELLRLPGVARKTANVVLNNAFGIIVGIPVDTHVVRITQRWGIVRSHDPKKIELELMKLYPKKEWEHLSYYIITHGRTICTAINRKCERCPLAGICPSSLVTPQSRMKNKARSGRKKTGA